MNRLQQAAQSMNLVDLISLSSDAEEVITFCARVSNPTNQLNMDTAENLLKYLITHKHWSPFEMASMTIQIKTSRAIAAQILRHRSFCFQEFSQRYAAVSEQVIYPARRQDTKNRQNSIDDMSEEDRQWFEAAQLKIWEVSHEAYAESLKRGIAKEQARFLLPLGTKTTMYMSGTLRSWIHYIELRSANGTQQEHMEIANGCKEIFVNELPVIAKALNWA